MKDPWFHIVCELEAGPKPTPTIRDIQRAVCGRFPGVTVNDLKSQCRPNEVILPRHIAIYLSRHLTQKSCPNIGREFGDRDHTTALYGIRKIERLAQQDRKLKQLLASITAELGCAA